MKGNYCIEYEQIYQQFLLQNKIIRMLHIQFRIYLKMVSKKLILVMLHIQFQIKKQLATQLHITHTSMSYHYRQIICIRSYIPQQTSGTTCLLPCFFFATDRSIEVASQKTSKAASKKQAKASYSLIIIIASYYLLQLLSYIRMTLPMCEIIYSYNSQLVTLLMQLASYLSKQ